MSRQSDKITALYCRDTSKKIRAVMKSKGEAGEYLCTNPPYGYMKDADNPKQWVVDSEAAVVVKRIFDLCLEGYGPLQIARILKERKVRSLSDAFYPRCCVGTGCIGSYAACDCLCVYP